MKAMFCGLCSSLQSPPENGDWRTCLCGASEVRWLDPYAGKLEVKSINLKYVRVLGMHNQFIQEAFKYEHLMSGDWREFHQKICESADGYVFHQNNRNCWAALVSKGETNDVTWTQGENR